MTMKNKLMIIITDKKLMTVITNKIGDNNNNDDDVFFENIASGCVSCTKAQPTSEVSTTTVTAWLSLCSLSKAVRA
jgi:hypothetical protein